MYLYELLKVHFNNVQLILSILISTGLIIPLGQFPLSLSLLSHPPSSSQTDRQLFVSLLVFILVTISLGEFFCLVFAREVLKCESSVQDVLSECSILQQSALLTQICCSAVQCYPNIVL